jgi:hypothetical protein
VSASGPAAAQGQVYAQRTGVARIDALIEQFRSMNVNRSYFIEWQWDPPVSAFAPGPRTLAMGACGSVSMAFNDLLAEHGLEVDLYHMAEDDPSGLVSWMDAGYHDEYDGALSEAEGHTVSLVSAGRRQYLIDWTAAQFGCTEFPLVQWREGGHWVREAA